MSADEVAVVAENGNHQNGTSKPEQESSSVEPSINGDGPVKRVNDESNGVTEEPPMKKSKTVDENGDVKAEVSDQKSPVPDDPDIKIIDDKSSDSTQEAKNEEKKKEPELTSSEALLNKLEEYVDTAMTKNDNTDRKVLDALLAAINIQVQREPLSVRKLILDKHLVLPNTISFPPSQVVDLLIEHDPDHPLQKVIARMFSDEKPKLSESEKKEKHHLKMNFGAPNMTKLLMDIGQDLVQESTYCDIVHARNLPEVPKNIETYKQVAAQLKPVWENLRKKNDPYKLKLLNCHVCGFRTESRLVMIKHRSMPHFDGKKYQCTMCPEFDTNESRMAAHYVEAHEVVPVKEEQPLRNPCHVCDEDFQLKGQRDNHYKICKRDYHRLRHIMSPKSPDDLCMINRWLWEKPPVDPSMLQQQQQAHQQHVKIQRQQVSMQQAGIMRAGSLANQSKSPMQTALLQQQQATMLAQQRLRNQMLLQKQAAQAAQARTPNQQQNQQNALILAMQQHLQQSKNLAGRSLQMNPALQKALNAKLQQQQQQQLLAQAARQLHQNGKTVESSSTSTHRVVAPQTPNHPSGTLLCEICDSVQRDKDHYLSHLQSQHRQMKTKVAADMQQGAPLACSRCRDRFWTYEGLERHLVMSHGLVTSDLLLKAQKKEDGGRCKICSKQYAFNMLQHLVADHQVKLCSAEIMYSCDVCAFKCQSYQKLEEHLTKLHPKPATAVKEPTTPAVPPKKSSDECIVLDD